MAVGIHLEAFGSIGTRSLEDSAQERELKLEGYQVLVPTVAGVGVRLKQDVLKAAQNLHVMSHSALFSCHQQSSLYSSIWQAIGTCSGAYNVPACADEHAVRFHRRLYQVHVFSAKKGVACLAMALQSRTYACMKTEFMVQIGFLSSGSYT